MPQYVVRDAIQDGDFLKQKQTVLNEGYGSIPGSLPQVLPKPLSGVRNLSTTDIQGA